MDAFIEMLNSVAADSTARFGSFLWQSTLLVFIVTLAAKWLGRATPAVRFWLWQIVALKLLLLPFWSVDATPPAWLTTASPTPTYSESKLTPPTQTASALPPQTQPQPSHTSPPLASSRAPLPTPTPTQKITWQSALILFWLAVILFRLTRILHQWQQLRQLLQQAIPSDTELTALVSNCAISLGLQTSPKTMLVDLDTSPFVCGLRQPTLVLPKSLTNTASPERLQQIILHELAHIKRRDLLWCWIPNLVQTVFWFHPAAYWVGHRVQLERELACDQLAIELSGSSAGEYAQTLIEVVSQTSAIIAVQKAALSHSLLGSSVS